MTQEIQKWADPAMFAAAPMEKTEDGRVVPQVFLLWGTPRPLSAIAAACRMYEGKPTYDLDDLTWEEKEHYFDQAMSTHLKAPLEFVKFHFFIEGVTRSFTHQMVRQRTAVYAQESLRFAVKEGFASEVALPPSIIGASDDVKEVWNDTIKSIEHVYERLVSIGIPAEDARGLLPHCVTTRLNYCTDLRALLDHAGNRLCTQAQFEWRAVFIGILQSLRELSKDRSFTEYDYLAKSGAFRPVCYQLNRCPFNATFDRACSIKGRVEAFTALGVPSSLWHIDHDGAGLKEDIRGIQTAEWLLNPEAAR